MRTTVRWAELSPETDGVRPSFNCVCFNPAGDTLVAGCGTRVVVYSSSSGTLNSSLRGHKDTVYAVSYASDGKKFASGGADGVVIIWSADKGPCLKYQHQASVQALAHNPVTMELASVSSVDFGVWNSTKNHVGKHKLPSKGLCAAWTGDGQFLAIGMFDGSISIRSRKLEETASIIRNAPVWTIAFSPQRDNGTDLLAVGCWDQTLSFYTATGKQIGKDRVLGYDPCCVSYFTDGDYMLISGSDHKATMYSKDGVHLIKLAEAEDWVWAAHQRPKSMQICCSTNDGTLSVIDINITVVHSIYEDQYVYRDNLTNVVVHQLTVDKKLLIPCGDYVRKLATYKDLLAVQFADKFAIYELDCNGENQMFYHDLACIRRKVECNIMCVTSDAIVVCQDQRLTMYDFDGSKRREWSMDSVVRYIKVIGGLDGREGLLVGLGNGTVARIFVNNAFPSTLVKIASPIRCVDLNCTRTKLAVVDDNSQLQVFDLSKNNEMLFSESDATAVAWNTDHEDMICYSRKGVLCIKTGALPAYQQKMQGLVVGFKANQIFHLHYSTMMTVDVPHSYALYRYVENKDFDAAYRIACLGVVEGDWKMLGMHAMTHLRLDIARKAFIRIREVKLVELLNRLELERQQMRVALTETEELLQGDIMAYQNKFDEAAKVFVRAGREDRAIDLYVDLKMWDEAKRVCTSEAALKEIIHQQARWAEKQQNFTDAATLYMACGDSAKATRMMIEANQTEKLLEISRSLSRSDVTLLGECAEYFKQIGAMDYAIEVYEKIDDVHSALMLNVELGRWERAFSVLEKYPEYARDVYMPWASWLAENDKFEEALEAFRLARWPKEAQKMMEGLASSSVVCRKFNDAAFYLIHLAAEYGVTEDGALEPTEEEWAVRIQKSADCVRRANLYYAYNLIHAHINHRVPYKEQVIFSSSKYLFACLGEGTVPWNIGKGEILFSLASVAKKLNMIRTARGVFERLQSIFLPAKIMEQVDIETLLASAKPFTDRDELLEVCYRCGQTVPQFPNPGDRCPACNHVFVRSFVGFEPLPLVELALTKDLTDAEAERILAGSNPEANKASEKGWTDAATGANVFTLYDDKDNFDMAMNAEMIALGEDDEDPEAKKNPFVKQLAYILRSDRPKNEYLPFMVNAAILRTLKYSEVFVVKTGFGTLPLRNKYYRQVRDDVRITLCPGCQHFFQEDDYERETVKGVGCPLCRYRPGGRANPKLLQLIPRAS